MTFRYRPELDMTELLPDDQGKYSPKSIQVLQWAVELCWTDIHV